MRDGLGQGGRWRGWWYLPPLFVAILIAGSLPLMAAGTSRVPVRGVSLGIVSEPSRQDVVADLGFSWVKYVVYWKNAQPQQGGTISFDPYDDWVDGARARGLRVLLRVDEPPSWATGSTAKNAPPLNDSHLADFLYEMALHFRGRVDAWEIWNEPNLNYEWGYQRPDPVRFTRMLQAAYPRIKSADPQTLVIVGGLSTTGGDFEDEGNEGHIGDLGYLTAMARAGARGYFDAIGSHPYGGPYPPEQDYDINNSTTPVGLYFRRAELQHEAWLRATGEDAAIWITEFGWIHDFGWNCTWADAGVPWGRQAQKVSMQQQADYLVRAYQFARARWPWAGPLIMYHLDKAIDTPTGCDNNYERFFGILNPDGSPAPAYNALRAVAKTDNLPPVTNIEALPVYSRGSFTVTWTGADNPGGSGIQYYDVQKRQSPGGWTNLLTGTVLTSTLVSGSDRQDMAFRVRAVDRSGNQELYRSEDGDRSTIVDASPPSSSVQGYAMPVTSTYLIPLQWSGSDDGSGITAYDVQYREGPSGTWTDLHTNSTYTQSMFYMGRDRQTFFFRSRARDQAGNQEEYSQSADAQVLVSYSPYITTTSSPPVWMAERGQSRSQTIEMANRGGSSTWWQAASNSPWLTVSPASGILGPGSTIALRISATAPASATIGTRFDASVVISGTTAWNSPISLGAVLHTVGDLNTTYLPVTPRAGSSW